MSTRYTKTHDDPNSIAMGYEGSNIPDDFSLPSCTIEDVDRALFNLFNEELPFFYEIEKETRRIPVIFATGERFAILRRKRPLRDNSGALILPLVSIMRTSITQESTKGAGPGEGLPLVIKKRLSKDDITYQRLINKQGLRNADDVASPENLITRRTDGGNINLSGSQGYSSKAGALATRRQQPVPKIDSRMGLLLKPNMKNAVYEVITIPPTKFFTVSYNVTFWTQYTQQINNMMASLMSSYLDMRSRSFRIETQKGYWFVAYVASTFTSDNNFDNFSDDERLVRYSFDIEVPAFLVSPDFPGAKNQLRKFTTAPELTFETISVNRQIKQPPVYGPISGDTNKFILQDLDGLDSFFPGPGTAPGVAAASDSRDLQAGTDASNRKTAVIGGSQGGKSGVTVPTLLKNPFTGRKFKTPLIPETITSKGELVYKDVNDGDEFENQILLEQIDS